MLKASRRWLPLALLAVFAGCGGPHPSHTTPPLGGRLASPPQLKAQCPPGAATMGCAITRSPALLALPPLTLEGRKIPDVSSYQGCPDWTAAKNAGADGGIAKAGEYITDPSLACNARGLRAVGLWHAYYWFVRGYSCATQAQRFVAAVRAVDGTVRVLVLDAEVPEARGQIPCMAAILRADGYIVVVYTAPGTWPGGGNASALLWVATYGPNPSFTNLWTTAATAWQFTGDCFGPTPHNFPGIGSCIDISLDYGITHLGVNPGPSPAQRARWTRALAASKRAYATRSCPTLAERIRFFSAHLSGPLAARHRRALAASQDAYARRSCRLFAGRISYYQQNLR